MMFLYTLATGCLCTGERGPGEGGDQCEGEAGETEDQAGHHPATTHRQGHTTDISSLA